MNLEVISHRPKKKTHNAPVLFIHGAWHGAWCWENFLPYFADNGFEAHALSLRGHGKSEGREGIRWYGISDYLADVDDVIKKIGIHPIVIGHSMGGFVTQKYLETHNMPAGVLVASIPVNGIFPMMFRFLQRRPRSTLKSLLLMDPWYLVYKPEIVKEFFFSDDLPESELERLFPLIQPESLRLAMDGLLFHTNAWHGHRSTKTQPSLFLRSKRNEPRGHYTSPKEKDT